MTRTRTGPAMTESAALRLDVCSALSQGARARQEDALVTAFPEGDDGGFAILSDGMGGHAAGDLASRIIVSEIFAQLMLRGTIDPDRQADVAPLLQKVVKVANSCIRSYTDANPQKRGMGGTVVATLVTGGMLHWISVGDSLLYLYRDGALTRLNADHSMGPQIDLMVDEGLLDAAAAERHPQRNCLTSALIGEDIPHIDCPATPLELRDGDLIVLASDGLQYLRPELIEATIAQTAEAQSSSVSRALMSALGALDDPEQDNTAIVILKVAAEVAEEIDSLNTGYPKAEPAKGATFKGWMKGLSSAHRQKAEG